MILGLLLVLSSTLASCDPDDDPGGAVPVESAPAMALPDDAVTAEDTPVNVDVLTNDVAPDGVPVLLAVNPPARGVAEIVGDLVRYSPDPDYFGRDRFTYTLAGGPPAEGVVSVTVTPVNDAPRAAPDRVSTAVAVPVTIAVLDNDDDVDGDTLTIVDVGSPANGIAESLPNSTILYTPDPAFSGVDSFRYTISDGQRRMANALVTVNVLPQPTLRFVYSGSDRELSYDSSNGFGFLNVPLFVEEDPGNVGYPHAIEAFSMVLAHDGALLIAVGARPGPALGDLPSGPEFFAVSLEDDGVLIEVVISETDRLTAEGRTQLTKIDYIPRPQVLGGNPVGDESVVSWFPTAANTIFAGVPVAPETENIVIMFTPLPPGPGFHYFAPGRGVTYDPEDGVAHISEPIFIQEGADTTGFPNPFTSFTLALGHDPTVLNAIEVRPGSFLEALNGGTGPEVFDVVVLPSGITLSVVFDLDPPVTLEAIEPREIAVVEYETVPDLLIGNRTGLLTPLAFVDGIGSPPVLNRVTLAGGGEAVPTLITGAILLRPRR